MGLFGLSPCLQAVCSLEFTLNSETISTNAMYMGGAGVFDLFVCFFLEVRDVF